MEKLRRGTQVKFNAISIIGEEIPMIGKIVGFASEIKKMWPEEFSGMSENEEIYLILMRSDSQKSHYVATPNEIIEVLKKAN